MVVEQLAEVEVLRLGVVEENRKVASELEKSSKSLITPTVLEWNGIHYVVRPDSIDQLTFHMYFALQVALRIHRDEKVPFDHKHMRFMIALSSVIRCGTDDGKKSKLNSRLCTLDCKTYGL